MHTEAWSWVVSWTLMLALGLVATLVLVGCETPAGPLAAPTLATPPVIEPQAPKADSDLAAETRALAQQLSSKLNDGSSERAVTEFNDPFAGYPPLDPRPTTATPAPVESSAAVAATPIPHTDEVAWLNGQAAASAPPAVAQVRDIVAQASPGYAPPPIASEQRLTLTRAELLEELAHQIKQSDDPELAKAVTAAALSLADPNRELDARLLEPLKPMQREAVERLQRLFVSLHHSAADPAAARAAATGGLFDHKALNEALADAFGEAPISIVHADLCRSVAGYGVYEPMGSHNFLSGRANRAIVYVEVEDFVAAKIDNDQREVKLTQELILYKESDGLAVWRHKPTQIVDVSRNRRRDFYVVQMITLPPRLGEGRYRLKVRLTDQHGDSVDETTLKVQVVADTGLLADDTGS
ncbi:MAG: hypothetical protein AAF333_14440 [Planctomycetota bacterium]